MSGRSRQYITALLSEHPNANTSSDYTQLMPEISCASNIRILLNQTPFPCHLFSTTPLNDSPMPKQQRLDLGRPLGALQARDDFTLMQRELRSRPTTPETRTAVEYESQVLLPPEDRESIRKGSEDVDMEQTIWHWG